MISDTVNTLAYDGAPVRSRFGQELFRQLVADASGGESGSMAPFRVVGGGIRDAVLSVGTAIQEAKEGYPASFNTLLGGAAMTAGGGMLLKNICPRTDKHSGWCRGRPQTRGS